MEKILNADDGSTLHVRDCINANGFNVYVFEVCNKISVDSNEKWADDDFSNFSFLGTCSGKTHQNIKAVVTSLGENLKNIKKIVTSPRKEASKY